MLIEVLTEPKNSLLRQYQHVLAMDDVVLDIEADALAAIADLALERGTGARGLRAILEDVLLNIMFDLPGRSDVVKCVITADTVRKIEEPTYELRKPARTRRAS
jgi:ATP-dependent Clp protease ATP-binding subunit ClpX